MFDCNGEKLDVGDIVAFVGKDARCMRRGGKLVIRAFSNVRQDECRADNDLANDDDADQWTHSAWLKSKEVVLVTKKQAASAA